MQSEPVQVFTVFPIMAIVIGALLAVLLLGGLTFICVRLTARRPVLLVPIGFGLLVLLGGVVAVPLYFHRLENAESARRAQIRAELETIAAALKEYHSTQPVRIEDHSLLMPDSDGSREVAGLSEPENTHGVESPAGDQPSLELVAFTGRDIVGEPLIELPDWVDDEPVVDSLTGAARKVLVSDQWATAEEADAQLTALTAAELSRFLAAEHPEAAGWLPDTAAIVQSGAVTRRVQETSTLPIGEFNPALYRAYWQLELTPTVREQLLDAWRPFAVSERLSWLGAGLAALTLLFAVLAAILRFGGVRASRGRPVLSKATIAALIITAGAAALLLA